MPRIKVTQKGVEALVKQPHPRRVDYFDAAHAGLCLTVGPKSATWYYFRRIDGRLTRMKIGAWPVVGIATAREEAGKVEATIAAGKHPKAEQARQRAAKRDARSVDEQRVARTAGEAWWAIHAPALATSTRADYRRALDEFIAAHGDDDIGALRRGQLIRHIDKIAARSPSAGNRAAVVIRLLYAFARDRYDLDSNPAADIRNPAKQAKRKRTLDRSEIRVLWKACERAGYPYGDALRFALCTGQRIGEVGSLRRSDIDSSGDYWTQENNKADRRIDLFLAKHARAILNGCPDFGRDAPFFSASADREGSMRPLRSDTWSNAIQRHIRPHIKPAAEGMDLHPIAKPWTPHDLRRTVRTALTGWCGVSPDTAERVLNHALSGLREVYDHADYRPHVADALQRWDRELTAILRGEKPQVISLDTRRARKRRTG